MDFTKLNSLLAVQKHFNTDTICREYLESVLWSGVPVCPHCGTIGQAYKLKDGKTYKCKEKLCAKKFTVTVGTIFDNTKIPLPKWFAAMYLVTSHKKGISSCQLAKDIEITQKSAWFVLGRIREMLKIETPVFEGGMVEVDEVFIGGRESNRHQTYKARKYRRSQGKGFAGRSKHSDKVVVLGLKHRDGLVFTQIIPNASRAAMFPVIKKQVATSALIVSDDWRSYRSLPKHGYEHEYVNHSANQYVNGEFHTNGIEGYWSQLKRGIYGVYHHCSRQHLHRYCDEFSFRYNTRKATEGERLTIALTQSAKRLTYNEYIGNIQ